MTQETIPFSPPDITSAEVEAVSEALLSGWITTGPRVKEFERRIADACGTNKAVCTNSATAALELALRLLGIGPGDEVITSAYTYTASCSPVVHVGAIPVLVDTAPGSYEMDYDALARAITPRTKAVIPIDVGGIVCDYDRIFQVVEAAASSFAPANDLQAAYGRPLVVADGAHCFGASHAGRRTGGIADFTTFSFHAVKNLTTAEGGALTWAPRAGVDDEELYHRSQLLSLHGQSKDAFAKDRPGAWEYDIVEIGYKLNMTDIMAAIGLAQLERYPGMLARRRKILERYEERVAIEGVELVDHLHAGSGSSMHLALVRVPSFDEAQRNELISRMAEQGVSTNVHYKPLPMHTAYQRLGFDIADFPQSFDQYRCEVTLPLYSKLTDEQVDRICETFTRVRRDMEAGR